MKFAGFCVLFLAISVIGWAKETSKSLPPTYRTWLNKDVVYIISNEERDAFLQLTTDDERNKFIERFWAIRNPTPGSPDNPYKTEHYRRLEYASQYFGSHHGDGWQTDMGRVYITLGAPQQKGRYVTQAEVRGMEVWFYSNAHPALPPFFSVIFYEKDFGDFRLYSPYMDGPQKLVTSYEAEGGRVPALQVIDRILGREVALTTLSLIPGEPVNIRDGISSLQSDVMLGTIKGLANHPFTVEALHLRKALNESITHRVVMPGELLKVLAVPMRDAQGNMRLHYVLRLSRAEDFGIGQSGDKYYYSLEVTVRVLTPESKLIFTQQRKLNRYLSSDEMDEMKNKPFGYEGWLSLAPGKYRLEFLLSNLVSKTAFPAEREIAIPEPPQEGFAVSDVMSFSSAEQRNPTTAAFSPFTFGGVNFTPYLGQDLALVPGQDLKVFYQIWLPRSPQAQDSVGQKLLVDYAFGRPGTTGSAQTIHDEIPRDQFDPGGSLINGKKIPTVDLPPGNYRLAITITDPEKNQRRYGSLAFHIVTEHGSPTDAWDVQDDSPAQYFTTGEADFERGITYLTGGQNQLAAQCFQRVLQRDPNNEKARSKLADFYFNQQQFEKIVQLYSQIAVTPQLEDETILNVADSYDKTGSTQKAAEWVESAIKIKPSSGPLYLALSSYYQRLGNSNKANELERKGRTLMTSPEANP